MEMVLPRNYVEIEQEEMMYLDGGKVTTVTYYNRTGFNSCYAFAVAFGANASYGAYITAGSAASGLGLPLSVFTGVTAAFQGYLASQFLAAGSQAEIYYKKYGKYTILTTTLFGVVTGVKAEMA